MFHFVADHRVQFAVGLTIRALAATGAERDELIAAALLALRGLGTE